MPDDNGNLDWARITVVKTPETSSAVARWLISVSGGLITTEQQAKTVVIVVLVITLGVLFAVLVIGPPTGSVKPAPLPRNVVIPS